MDLLEWPIDLNALKYDDRFKNFVTDQKNWAPDKEGELERKMEEDKAKKKAEAKAKKRKEKLEE